MSEDFGRQIKTAAQPWWLVAPLLLIPLALAPAFLQKTFETKQLLEQSAQPVSTTEHAIKPYLENRLDAEVAARQVEANTQLQVLVKTWVDSNDGDFAVVVRELSEIGRSAEVNSGVQFVSASTYKLFLVYAVLHEIETGGLGQDSLTSLNRTVLSCIDSLLLYSWDVCAYPMGQLVGWAELSDLLIETGFKDTDINNYDSQGGFNGDKYTTAADESLFMEKLYGGQLLNEAHSELMLSKLKAQKWRERIPAGVPEGIVVADKPGWLNEYENDAAIVYGDHSTYVLVVLSNNSSKAKIAELSGLIYQEMDQPLQ